MFAESVQCVLANNFFEYVTKIPYAIQSLYTFSPISPLAAGAELGLPAVVRLIGIKNTLYRLQRAKGGMDYK